VPTNKPAAPSPVKGKKAASRSLASKTSTASAPDSAPKPKRERPEMNAAKAAAREVRALAGDVKAAIREDEVHRVAAEVLEDELESLNARKAKVEAALSHNRRAQIGQRALIEKVIATIADLCVTYGRTPEIKAIQSLGVGDYLLATALEEYSGNFSTGDEWLRASLIPWSIRVLPAGGQS
jgi:ketosteroid isomerase-like protein